MHRLDEHLVVISISGEDVHVKSIHQNIDQYRNTKSRNISKEKIKHHTGTGIFLKKGLWQNQGFARTNKSYNFSTPSHPLHHSSSTCLLWSVWSKVPIRPQAAVYCLLDSAQDLPATKVKKFDHDEKRHHPIPVLYRWQKSTKFNVWKCVRKMRI